MTFFALVAENRGWSLGFSRSGKVDSAGSAEA